MGLELTEGVCDEKCREVLRYLGFGSWAGRVACLVSGWWDLVGADGIQHVTDGSQSQTRLVGSGLFLMGLRRTRI